MHLGRAEVLDLGLGEAEALQMRYHLRRAKPRGAPAGWMEEASYDPEDATGNSLLIPLSRFLLLWRSRLLVRSAVGKIKHALLANPVIFGACARWTRPAMHGRRNRICTCESRLLSASLCLLSNRSGYFFLFCFVLDGSMGTCNVGWIDGSGLK
jgi:hypothetical protein